MKIIKQGKLPTPCKVVMEGTCRHCGCVVQEEYEVFTETRGINRVSCPTYGYPELITMFGVFSQQRP